MSERKSEDEYFKRIEQEQKDKLRAKLDADQAVADKQTLKELHWNKCGKCGSDMDTKVFRGVEVEVCPDCGAVLLDPGELETLAGQDNAATFTSFFSMFGGGRQS